MSEKTYSVIHLYMGEVCRSEHQPYQKVVSTLRHTPRIKGWSTKKKFFEIGRAFV